MVTITVVLEHQPHNACELRSIMEAIRQLRGVSEVHAQIVRPSNSNDPAFTARERLARTRELELTE
jgi:hypothetical protein